MNGFAGMKPSLVVGLGGVGLAIVLRAIERLRAMAEISGDPEALEDVRKTTRFVAIDTQATADHQKVPTSLFGTFIHLGDHRGVNDTVERLFEGNDDPFFRTWWPASYLNVGDIVDGAGNRRPRGKLAYYLYHRTHGQEAVVSAIQSEIDILAPTGSGVDSVPVYFVGSLSGGTGGGLLLAVAQELEDKIAQPALDQYAMVIDGADLADEQSASDKKQRLRANCWAALNELNFWTSGDRDRKQKFQPFWRRGDREISGNLASVLKLIFFFRKGNQGGHFSSITELIDYVSDCLVTRLGPSTTAEGMAGLEVDLAQDLKEREEDLPPTRKMHSIRFGSIGVASVRFPADRVLDFLARMYAPQVLDEFFVAPTGEVTSRASIAAQMFLISRNLIESSGNHLSTRLQRRVPKVKLEQVSSPRRVLLGGGAGDVSETLKDFENRQKDRYDNLEDTTRTNVETMTKAVTADLDRDVEALLGSGEPYAAVETYQFLDSLKTLVEGEMSNLTTEAAGEKRSTGLHDQLVELEKDRAGKRKDLTDGFSSFLNRKKADAVDLFIKDWWDKYYKGKERVHLIAKCKDVHTKLSDSIKTHWTAVAHLQEFYSGLATSLKRDASSALAGPKREESTAVQEIAVLSDPSEVLEMGELPETADREDGEILLAADGQTISWALALYRRVLTDLTNARVEEPFAPVNYEAAFRDALLAVCRKRLHPRIADISVWSALRREAERQGIHERDAQVNYIRDRVRRAATAARPFWHIDPSSLGRPIPSVLAFYSSQHLASFEQELGVPLEPIIGDALRAGFGRQFVPYDSGDKYELLAYYSEIGVPLANLHQTWRRDLEEAFRGLPEDRLWTDSRYCEGAIPIVSATETEAEFHYLLALGLALNILRIRRDGKLYYGGGKGINPHTPLAEEKNLNSFFAGLQRSSRQREILIKELNDNLEGLELQGPRKVSAKLEKARDLMYERAAKARREAKLIYSVAAEEVDNRLERSKTEATAIYISL